MEIFTYPGLIALLQVIGIDLVLAGDNAIVIGLAAVSYTHLDVYKRQVIRLCNWRQTKMEAEHGQGSRRDRGQNSLR